MCFGNDTKTMKFFMPVFFVHSVQYRIVYKFSSGFLRPEVNIETRVSWHIAVSESPDKCEYISIE